MTQPPVQPPAWGRPGMPMGPGVGATPPPAWQSPGAPPVPQQPGPPAWEQRPGPPAGPPPGGFFAPPPAAPRSRKGLWWSIGAAVVALLVAGGVLFFVLMGGIEAPTGVSATVQPDGVAVSWTGVEGASSYEVFRGDTSAGTTDQTTFLDADAPGGTEVRYTVVAVNQDGDRSEASAAGPAVITAVDAPAPAATVDGAAVQLVWEEVTGAETYAVTRDGESLAGDLTETTYLDPEPPAGDHSYEVTAVDADGEGSSATGSVQVSSPGPWVDANAIAAAFPELVGSSPGGGDAWNGASCSTATPEAAQAAISCDYASGILMVVTQYTDTGQRDARVAEVGARPDVQTGTWSYGSGDPQGDLWIGVADSTIAWRFITFYESGRELFSIYAEWDGHSQDQLRDEWFAGAPF